ncbi:hypothetical protein Hypma_005097 [Hypsizygus marmoreus]|uniref:Uncharacterized protein n=1 Tax=Hypsizygus marmoreus TaxID=39966 RepID=A0A369K391_HYPMA|nr:hypothetical protein Hypma_005097 [Hypsizygus marmoreus]
MSFILIVFPTIIVRGVKYDAYSYPSQNVIDRLYIKEHRENFFFKKDLLEWLAEVHKYIDHENLDDSVDVGRIVEHALVIERTFSEIDDL